MKVITYQHCVHDSHLARQQRFITLIQDQHVMTVQSTYSQVQIPRHQPLYTIRSKQMSIAYSDQCTWLWHNRLDVTALSANHSACLSITHNNVTDQMTWQSCSTDVAPHRSLAQRHWIILQRTTTLMVMVRRLGRSLMKWQRHYDHILTADTTVK